MIWEEPDGVLACVTRYDLHEVRALTSQVLQEQPLKLRLSFGFPNAGRTNRDRKGRLPCQQLHQA